MIAALHFLEILDTVQWYWLWHWTMFSEHRPEWDSAWVHWLGIRASRRTSRAGWIIDVLCQRSVDLQIIAWARWGGGKASICVNHKNCCFLPLLFWHIRRWTGFSSSQVWSKTWTRKRPILVSLSIKSTGIKDVQRAPQRSPVNMILIHLRRGQTPPPGSWGQLGQNCI